MKKTQAMEKVLKKMNLVAAKNDTDEMVVENIHKYTQKVAAKGDVKEGSVEFGSRNFAGTKKIIALAIGEKMNCEVTIGKKFGKRQITFKGIKENIEVAKALYTYLLDHCAYVEKKMYLEFYKAKKDTKNFFNTYTGKITQMI